MYYKNILQRRNMSSSDSFYIKKIDGIINGEFLFTANTTGILKNAEIYYLDDVDSISVSRIFRIIASVSNANIYIDGSYFGKSPVSAQVKGIKTLGISARMEGYVTKTINYTVRNTNDLWIDMGDYELFSAR